MSLLTRYTGRSVIDRDGEWDALATELMVADVRCSTLSSASGRLTDEVAAVEDEASEVQERFNNCAAHPKGTCPQPGGPDAAG